MNIDNPDSKRIVDYNNKVTDCCCDNEDEMRCNNCTKPPVQHCKPPVSCYCIQGPAGPPGRDGQDGLPGKDGKDGLQGSPGKDGKDGLPGKDGKE